LTLVKIFAEFCSFKFNRAAVMKNNGRPINNIGAELRQNLNILTDPAFRVRLKSGEITWVTFANLMATTGDHPVAFAWPRADLNIASFELAIGLTALLWQPTHEDKWKSLWENADPAAALSLAITSFAPCFSLFGEGSGNNPPRFMQDAEDLQGKGTPIGALFIDAPGENAANHNKDLLTHRGRYPALGLKAAAMTLYALQQFAPSGGAGNRTSMRGGGPMTTLALPGGALSTLPLWRVILANLSVSNRYMLTEADRATALPWLAPTLTSKGDDAGKLSEGDKRVHQLQAFFGMPRRIRLRLLSEPGICALTGEEGPVVAEFVQNPWGVNYGNWFHPLTPYRQQKEGAEPYSVKPKAAVLTYRDWVGLALKEGGGAQKAPQKAATLIELPAASIKAANGRAHDLRHIGNGQDPHFLAAGWAMNNMDAEAYLHAVQPLYLVDDDGQAESLAFTAEQLRKAGEEAASALKTALKQVIRGDRKGDTDTGLFAENAAMFFARTEPAFHAHLRAMTNGQAFDDKRKQEWLRLIRREALALFNSHARANLGLLANDKTAERVAKAYDSLSYALSDNARIATSTLQLPKPETADKKEKHADE
jgi:CRISPR system Cascade subunit CasA